MKDNVVTYVSLMSEEAAEKKRLEAAKQRELNTEQGIEVRDKILADAEFAELPPSDQEAFWKDFRGRYPDVNVEAEYEKARLAARRDAEKQREEDRLTNLEDRVRAAEEQSRRAEKAAAQRAWPEEYPRRSRATTVNDGIYIRYNTGRRIYYPHYSYPPIVISTQANSNSHKSQSTPPLRHWNSERHLQNSNNRNWNTHPQEETYIYGRGGNTQLNIGRTRW